MGFEHNLEDLYLLDIFSWKVGSFRRKFVGPGYPLDKVGEELLLLGSCVGVEGILGDDLVDDGSMGKVEDVHYLTIKKVMSLKSSIPLILSFRAVVPPDLKRL